MTANQLRDTIGRGINAHQAGQLKEALACYREALAIAPQDAEAVSLCGLALLHLGDTTEAMTRLIRAVELEPQVPGFRLNLIEGFERTKNFDRALGELRIIANFDPNNVRALEKSGDIHAATGDTDGAVVAWLRAYSLQPGHVVPALKAAQTEIGRGRAELALRVLDSVAAQQPGNVALFVLRSEALIARRDWQRLRETAATWTRLEPSNPAAWRMAARAAFEQGFHTEAAAAFAAAMRYVTPTAADYAAYASLSLHALNMDDAARALEQAEALGPEHTEMLSMRALLLMYLGRFEEAESYARRAIARDPDCVPAYTTLSRLGRGQLSDKDLTAVTSLALRHAIHLDRRIPAAFAAARAREARGSYDAAFAAYEYAHELALERDALEGRKYDPAQADQRTEQLIQLSAISLPEFVRPSGAPRPIFIVGMPRSGTTLIEGVLGAHTRVFACGERPAMQQILRAYLALDDAEREPDAEILQEWTAAYFRELPNLGGKDHITDKHPLNFDAVGLISQLFPDATIVHVHRDPVETCLSIYCQEFNKHWAFAHRLEDIGHYYGHYLQLAAHWEQALGKRLITVEYEDFVENFERAARSLVESCRLEWEPACLQFQHTERAIATFSTVQVRDPIQLGESRAERYAEHLAPLMSALEQAGVDPVTGSFSNEAEPKP
jgi:tetratricopeptide (TPR) repeat protein